MATGILQPGYRILVEPISPTLWRTDEDIRVRVDGREFFIPRAYVTDFATVPRVAVWLIPRWGAYTIAAIFHDWLLTHELPTGRVTAVEADHLFRMALRELRVPPLRRAWMWTGVRYGAGFSRKRRANWWSTFPHVFLYSLLFLATVILPLVVIGVGLALVVYGALEFIASSVSDKDEATTGSLST